MHGRDLWKEIVEKEAGEIPVGTWCRNRLLKMVAPIKSPNPKPSFEEQGYTIVPAENVD